MPWKDLETDIAEELGHRGFDGPTQAVPEYLSKRTDALDREHVLAIADTRHAWKVSELAEVSGVSPIVCGIVLARTGFWYRTKRKPHVRWVVRIGSPADKRKPRKPAPLLTAAQARTKWLQQAAPWLQPVRYGRHV